MIKVTYNVVDYDGSVKNTYTKEFSNVIEQFKYEQEQEGHPWLRLVCVKTERSRQC